MSLHIVCADELAPQPWRNRGGRTRELLAWPNAADWHLRISVADIESDGPFSTFDGVQRWFAVISGAGVLLRFGDGERRVCAGDAPLAFDGAAAPGCRLIDGPTRDLNLMARGGGSAHMLAVTADTPWRSTAAQRGLFCAVAGRCADDTGASVAMPALTLLWQAQGGGDGALNFAPDHHPGDGPLGWWLEYSPA